MKLLKVHVHNYRHLKDVSLTFEPDLYPQVFAIGSENGGGKSTLLQLIFTFLHCAPHPELHKFVINAIQHMKGFLENWEEEIHQIIDIDLMDEDGNNISISYLIYPIVSKEIENVEELSISDAINLISLVKSLESKINFLDSERKICLQRLEQELDLINSYRSSNHVDKKLKIQNSLSSLEKQINVAQEELYSIPENACYQILREENIELLFPVHIVSRNGAASYYHLCYKIKSTSSIAPNDILFHLSKYIFLAGQTTQPYIFLSNETIRDMFDIETNYGESLENARFKIGNLYNFNAFAINEIIAAFNTADRKSVV
jgi:hypothetical protein